MRALFFSGIAILCAALSACAGGGRSSAPSAPPALTLSPVSFDALPGWKEQPRRARAAAVASLRRSCTVYGARPSGEDSPAELQRAAVDMQGACAALATPNVPVTFESNFCPYRLSAQVPAFFTGYYAPELDISHERTDEFSVPIYGKPTAPWRGNPPTRKDIEEWGALAGNAPVIAWARDRVALYFLHVQGSGTAVYPDGVKKKLVFAGKTGLPYTSIGSILIARGDVSKENMNGATLKKWLYDHKKEGEALMWENPSYVFFSIADESDGVVGASGAVLTPEHSLAVDSRFIPYGLPLWIDTTRSKDGKSRAPFRTLAVSQDGGSAIKGPLRADIFFGAGKNAENFSYRQQFTGDVYALLPCDKI
ncbi:MAG: MltA domain-containing protein [Rickettsiales bacterium]